MSAGYTPLFASITTGTLCGKWPDIGLWPIVLSLADKNGVVDVTCQYLSTVTGLSLSEVVACMKRFCEADPGSRSPSEAGARLLLLEEHREWGWQIVNFSAYRERARLMAQNAAQVGDGRNAEKCRRYRENHQPTPADTARHPPTPADTLSNANANAYPESEHARAERSPTDASTEGRARTAKRGSRIPEPFAITDRMREWANSETPDVDLTAATAEFIDYWRGVPGQKGCKLDWDGTWRNRMRDQQARVSAGKPTLAKRAPRREVRLRPDAFEVARRGS